MKAPSREELDGEIHSDRPPARVISCGVRVATGWRAHSVRQVGRRERTGTFLPRVLHERPLSRAKFSQVYHRADLL